MNLIKKIDSILLFIEKAAVILLFFLLVVLTTGNIIARNLLHTSFNFIVEISPLIVLWLALAGSTIALKQDRHIKLELILRFLSPQIRFAAHILSGIFGMTIMGILCYASVDFVKNEVIIFGFNGLTAIIFPLFFALSSFRFFTGILLSPAAKTSTPHRFFSKPTPNRVEK